MLAWRKGRGEVFFWALAGFFWGMMSVGLLGDISGQWQGVHDFSGCLADAPRMTRTGSLVRMDAELDSVRLAPVQIRIPAGRGGNDLGRGDCLTGTALFASSPSPWEREHLFGSSFRPVLLEGQVLPWDPLSVTRSQEFSSGPLRQRESLLMHRLASVFSPDVAGLAGAMILSDTSLLPDDLLRSFQSSGAYHLLSVSGEHMALLALFLNGSLFILLRLIPYPLMRRMLVRVPLPALAGWLLVPVLVLYLTLIGSPLPAVRAVVAFALLMAFRSTGRMISWPDVFGLSLLGIIALYPEAPLSLSMDLSLLALWGLLLGCRWESSGKGEKKGKDFEGSERGFREHLVTGVAVMLTTLPLLWFSVGKADWVGIFSNIFVVPVAGDLFLPLGFLATMLLSVFPDGWPPYNFLVEKTGESAVGLVDFFSRIPYGQVRLLPVSPLTLLLMTSLILLAVRWRNRELLHGGRKVIAGMAAVIGLSIVLSHGLSVSGITGPERALSQPAGEEGEKKWRWEPFREGHNLEWLFSLQSSGNRKVR
uniref:ComEC/Rec2 family competence protein n=1 Tax=Leptospirillum ferriphilum TaxID=178606 RepID=A0A7C3QV11_9BACT